MESFEADLKKQVQCSLCHDTLTEPKILPCFDVFCKPCIKRHAELIDEVNVFNCPKCKSQTPLKELNSVEDLQPSLLHSRLLKGLALVEGEKVCSVHESHSTASWYCFDCDHWLCEECKKSHSLFTKDHKIVCLSEVKKEDIEFMITRENACKNHPRHRVDSFCENCDHMICVTCWQDHNGHKTMTLDKFATIKKALLSKHLKAVEQLEADDKEKQKQEKIANTIKQQGEKAIQEVKDKTRKIMKMIQENEGNLMRQIDEKLDIATTNLNIIHNIPVVKEYIENMMERGLASEMMDIKDEQCFQKFIFNHIPPFSRVEFVPNEQLVQEAKSGLGEIRTCLKTDLTKSTIEVKSVTTALKKEKLTLTTKSSTGELHHDPRDVIDIQIKPKENVKVEKKQVRSDGKVEVEFMAKVAGQLIAEVQVNGNHVSNSPLVANVKPQEMRVKRFNLKGVNLGSSHFRGIAVNRGNSLIAVANSLSECVHVFITDGDFLLTYGSQGSSRGQLYYPTGLAFLNDRDLVIADRDNHRIAIMNAEIGTLVKTFGYQGNGDGEFSHPWGVHVDDNGHIVVCDRDNHRVQVFTRDGDFQYHFGLTTRDNFDPVDVITHDRRFYVSDYSNHVIHVFKRKRGNAQTRVSTIGGYGNADGQLNSPWGLAIDNDHHLLVCDLDKRVQKFTLDGRFVGKTRDALKSPQFITVLKDGQTLVSTYDSGVWSVQ